MRVLHVLSSLKMGGAEKLVTDLVPIQKELGNEVDVMVLNGDKESTPFALTLTEKGVQIIAIDKGGESPYHISYVRRVIPYLRQYDVIHTHTTAPLYIFSLAKKLSRSRVCLVTTEHSTHNHRRGKLLFKLVDKVIYRSYSQIVCISQKAKENLEKHLDKATINIRVIENGINVEAFHNASRADRRSFFCTNTDFIIIMVGRFVDAKDQDTLIKALPQLPQRVKLVLVGEGDRKEYCQQLAESLHLMDRVIFLGIRTDVPQLLQASDVVALSSHWEGLSLSSIEGMAVEKPFIASNVAGLCDVVEGFGLLFEEGNASQFAQMILILLSDPIKYNEISSKCYSRACNYDIRRVAHDYCRLYNELLYNE